MPPALDTTRVLRSVSNCCVLRPLVPRVPFRCNLFVDVCGREDREQLLWARRGELEIVQGESGKGDSDEAGAIYTPGDLRSIVDNLSFST